MLDILSGDSEASKVHSFIGVVVAISGNIIISLALNCQKLAHKRLEAEASQRTPRRLSLSTSNSNNKTTSLHGAQQPSDTTPLKPLRLSIAKYSSAITSTLRIPEYNAPSRYTAIPNDDNESSENGDIPHSSDNLTDSTHADAPQRNRFGIQEEEEDDAAVFSTYSTTQADELPPPKMEPNYLKSKLWWFGFTLMNIGEIGNFLSYGFAPASLVAPLGSFALIANCIFAPLMLGENFRKLDLLGLTLCIVGIVTIVLGGKTSNVRLDPDALISAISHPLFVVYSIVNVVLVCILAPLSNRKIGQEKAWIDLGLCALFGGYTVLCTKGISTLLSLAWIQTFKFWITYPLAVILLITGVGQIRYLNRALMKFDSKVVIPTQFVLFNLAAIVGSAVLYRDFDKLPFERFVIFLYGCAATFIGVFILARPNQHHSDDDEASTMQGDAVDTQSESTASVTPRRTGTHHRNSFTSFPQNQNLPVLGSTGGPSTGPLRVRPRASSSGIGLSPAKYLLIATEPVQPSGPPPLGSPISRQQPTPPQRPGSYQPTSSRIVPSRIASRSPSRDRGGEGARSGENYNSRAGI